MPDTIACIILIRPRPCRHPRTSVNRVAQRGKPHADRSGNEN